MVLYFRMLSDDCHTNACLRSVGESLVAQSMTVGVLAERERLLGVHVRRDSFTLPIDDRTQLQLGR